MAYCSKYLSILKYCTDISITKGQPLTVIYNGQKLRTEILFQNFTMRKIEGNVDYLDSEKRL